MDLERCCELVADALAGEGAAAGEGALAGEGAARPVAMLSDTEAAAVLDLARAAAHAVERKAAPLVCFMAGLALATATESERVTALGAAAAAIDAAAAAIDADAVR